MFDGVRGEGIARLSKVTMLRPGELKSERPNFVRPRVLSAAAAAARDDVAAAAPDAAARRRIRCCTSNFVQRTVRKLWRMREMPRSTTARWPHVGPRCGRCLLAAPRIAHGRCNFCIP